MARSVVSSRRSRRAQNRHGKLGENLVANAIIVLGFGFGILRSKVLLHLLHLQEASPD